MTETKQERQPWDYAGLPACQAEHEQLQRRDAAHDRSSCWCCCETCQDDDDDEVEAVGE